MFDAATLLHYNIAAFVFLALGVLCLLATSYSSRADEKPPLPDSGLRSCLVESPRRAVFYTVAVLTNARMGRASD